MHYVNTLIVLVETLFIFGCYKNND